VWSTAFRLVCVAAILGGLVLATGVSAATTDATAAADTGTYSGQVNETVHVPTRYGDKLTIELEFPAVDGKKAPGKFPVIACLCYITNVDTIGVNVSPLPDSAFARAGYVAATVRVAGSGTSEGGPWDLSNTKWQQENYDAIEWLGTQSWSTGKVGTIGESGNGMSQIFTSQLKPPHLTTMIPTAAGADSYDTLVPGGMISLQILAFACGIPGAATTAANGLPIPALNSSIPPLTPQELAYLVEANLKKVGTANVKPFCPLLDGWYNHPTRDAFWTGAPLSKVQDVTIPTWAWSGWDDIFRRAVPNLYKTVGSSQKMLTMGLNSHESPGGGDGFDQTTEALQWFDHFLKGKDNSVTQQIASQGFRYYLNRGFVWKSAPAFPIPGTSYTPFYFGNGSTTPLASGSLSSDKSTAGGANNYLYTPLSMKGLGTELTDDLVNPFDPNNPTNDTLLNNNLTDGDQRLDLGPDTVTYVSQPLAQDTEVTGPITATLFAKTTSADTDFVVKLNDVFPDTLQSNVQPGFWKLVTSANIKGTFRTYQDNYAKETPIPTGQAVRYDLEGQPTSYLFQKGHRIAITVSSSDAPRLMPNLNSAAVTILHGPQYPSEITLPVIPPGLTQVYQPH
jgi:hypothetical protein